MLVIAPFYVNCITCRIVAEIIKKIVGRGISVETCIEFLALQEFEWAKGEDFILAS